jgi:hypothetical protein
MLKRGLANAAAITLLLLAGADLAFPSLCSAERIPQLYPVTVADPPAGEEDCFCCCPHIRPQAIIQAVEGLQPLSERKESGALPVPDIRPHKIFHPPKD